MSQPNGIVLYRGPSLIDGSPIICILTGIAKESKNAKTGDELQTQIIREDVAPHIAAASGLDSAICGNCEARPTAKNYCYVQKWREPNSVFECFHRGGYTLATEHELQAIKSSGIAVRAGSYGDPAAVPLEVWRSVGVRTGYTHQWEDERVKPFAELMMASVETLKQKEAANEKGFRTFRVITSEDELQPDEILCVNQSRGVDCATCGICAGQQVQAKNVGALVHGAKKGNFLQIGKKKKAAVN